MRLVASATAAYLVQFIQKRNRISIAVPRGDAKANAFERKESVTNALAKAGTLERIAAYFGLGKEGSPVPTVVWPVTAR